MTLPPGYASAIRRHACRTLSTSPQPTDDELCAALGQHFGIEGGYGSRGVALWWQGGKNPTLSIEFVGEPPLKLKGRKLLDAVREALFLSRPAAVSLPTAN